MYALYSFEQKNVNDSLLKIDFFRKNHSIQFIRTIQTRDIKEPDLVTINISLPDNGE